MGWLLGDPWIGGAFFEGQDPSANGPSIHRSWAWGQLHLWIGQLRVANV